MKVTVHIELEVEVESDASARPAAFRVLERTLLVGVNGSIHRRIDQTRPLEVRTLAGALDVGLEDLLGVGNGLESIGAAVVELAEL